jgi:integrase/recombinase XerD
MNIREATQEYITSVKRLRPMTKEGYRQKLAVFTDWCETNSVTLETIRAKVVDEFLDHLRNTRTPHKANNEAISTYTLAGYVRVILSFLNWCLDDEEYSEYVKHAVVRRIKKPKIIETIIETFTSEQIEALFAACDRQESEHLQLRDRAILSLLLDTGIRANELCTLTIGNVDTSADDPHITVFGKGSKWREVGLGATSRRVLRRYIRQFRATASRNEPVFVGRYHEPLTTNGLGQLVLRLGKVAGIQGVRCSPHTFRHYFAINYLLQKDSDIYRLSRLMGHTDIEVTTRYLKAMKQKEARQGGQSVLDSMRGKTGGKDA